VANITGSQAARVNTRAQVNGGITQIQGTSTGGVQSLTAGSVTNVDAVGQVSTIGTLFHKGYRPISYKFTGLS